MDNLLIMQLKGHRFVMFLVWVLVADEWEMLLEMFYWTFRNYNEVKAIYRELR